MPNKPIIHGHHRRGQTSPTYYSWQAMKTRCLNPNRSDNLYYKAKGIRVCLDWMRFENFLADMGERPLGTSLDRIDSDGDYCPENCRWATAQEQTQNRKLVVRPYRPRGPRGLTHCPHGHAYTAENLLVYGNKRMCRICRKAAKVRYRAKARATMPL